MMNEESIRKLKKRNEYGLNMQIINKNEEKIEEKNEIK